MVCGNTIVQSGPAPFQISLYAANSQKIAESAVKKGSRLEFVRPDGAKTFAVVTDMWAEGLEEGGRDEDDMTMYWFGVEPLIRIRLRPQPSDVEAPAGTEIWLLDEDGGASNVSGQGSFAD